MSRESAPAPARASATLLEEGTVLRIVLDRPKGNILTMELMGALSEALAVRGLDPHLRLVLIRGAGGHFSYGASVEEHRPELAPRMLRAFHELARQVAAHPVPVAALVEGSCFGGAFELALCCHFVFATPNARFACPEIKLGVFPPVLAAIGGLRMRGFTAERLILTGGSLDAATAEREGLVTAVFGGDRDPEEDLLEWYRQNLRSHSAYSLRQATRAARVGSGLSQALDAPLGEIERQYVERILTSHDGNEGIAAFLERRQPAWEDA